HQPDGVSKNGGAGVEVVVPQGIVLAPHGSATPPAQLPVLWGVRGEGGKNQDADREMAAASDQGAEPRAPAMPGGGCLCPHLGVPGPAPLHVKPTREAVAERVENGRRVTEWRTDHPVRIFNIVAGNWAVKQREGAAVYYDPRHPYNAGEMLDALVAARRWYGEWFAPFPWKTLRVSEVAGLPTYAQAPPGNISFSENIGFLSQSKAEANAAFWITAHEAAHQWWPNLAMVGDGPGTEVLSEGMAHFSTILLCERARGIEQRM